ncbi:collagen alpha-1(I) chain isoform X2 [Balaenoptera musculus]|uniref:Collagen alpha-1(I) chain isoform X2 n=1 Tax=Balaenoptera musculus TaxID=9771 RepID=A0A8B8V6F5_BALMU|nr:collagen alpha-1(I) chain isoform X2 [Balaenoptera musculus]
MWRAGPEGLPGDLGVGQQADPCPSRPLAQQYGPAFTVHLGRQKTVVLTGYEAVREALLGTGQELAGRPPILIFQLIQGGGGPQASSSPPGRAEGPPASSPHAPSTAWAWGGRPWPTRSCRSRGASRRSCTATEQFYYRDPVFVSLLGLIDKVMVLLGTPSLQGPPPAAPARPAEGGGGAGHPEDPHGGTAAPRAWARACAELPGRPDPAGPGERPRGPVCRGQRGGLCPGHGHGWHGDHVRHAAVGRPPDGQAPQRAGPGAGGAGPSAGAWAAPPAGGPAIPALHQRRAARGPALHHPAAPHAAVHGLRHPAGRLPAPQGPPPRAPRLRPPGWMGRPSAHLPPLTGHACGAPPELRAPGQDAVGDPPPAQPGPLPGRGRALREAGGLPAFFRRYCSPAGGGLVPGASRAQGPQPAGLPLPRHGLRHPPRTPRPLQAAVSAWGRAWPGRRCSCCSQASCSGTACCPRPASAPPPWTPRPPWPSPRGRRPRPCVRCPGCRGADHERPGLTTGQSPRAGEGLSHSRLVVLGSRASVARQHLPGRGATHLQLGMQADGRGCWAPG